MCDADEHMSERQGWLRGGVQILRAVPRRSAGTDHLVHAARDAWRRGGIGNGGRSKGRGWIDTTVAAEFCGVPKGDTTRTWPTCARRRNRGRPGVIGYWS